MMTPAMTMTMTIFWKFVISAINPQLCPAHPAKTTARTSGLKNWRELRGKGVWMGSFSDIMFRRLTFLTALLYAIAKGRQMNGDKKANKAQKGDKWKETRHRQDRREGHRHSGRQMKGDKAQTRPERRTPPIRETHERRQMKGDKWRETGRQDRRGGHHHSQTRPERRTPPLRETHEGRHMKGDTWRETNEGRRGTDKTGEADTTTQGDTWRETRHRQDRRGGHHHSGRHMKGDKRRETRHRQDRRGGHHHSGRHMKGDKWRETRHRQDRRGGHHQSQRGGDILRKNWEPLAVNCLGKKPL